MEGEPPLTPTSPVPSPRHPSSSTPSTSRLESFRTAVGKRLVEFGRSILLLVPSQRPLSTFRFKEKAIGEGSGEWVLLMVPPKHSEEDEKVLIDPALLVQGCELTVLGEDELEMKLNPYYWEGSLDDLDVRRTH
mmetsp:Transcript_30195/g.73479  ORF Transcript_30195/g.73479 Transcript_30195/m.73479 type:complete len:134 (+) Transcript_30195:108-509(+)